MVIYLIVSPYFILPMIIGGENSKSTSRNFPGGAVVKNPPANAGNTGSSPGPGGSHIRRSN